MNALLWLRTWLARRRDRKRLLATPGVDWLVQRVMDKRYGRHHWRVMHGQLEALVCERGGRPMWGLIGPLNSPTLRSWLLNVHVGNNPSPLRDIQPSEYDEAADGPDTVPWDAEKGEAR